MNEGLQQTFIATLESKYGPRSAHTAKFGNTSYGEIAADLSISASQFSKLVSGTATDGMYSRSIKNVQRLIKRAETRKERDAALAELKQVKKRFVPWLISAAVLGVLSGLIFSMLYFGNDKSTPGNTTDNEHPLSKYFDQGFDAAFDSPYLSEAEVQAYCPCSAYEGEWSLATSFKLPLPGSRKPGLYYLAKKGDLKMRCSNINAPYVEKGKSMVGYEHLVSEVWIDTEQEPLIPRYFNIETKNYTPEFLALNFEDNPRFKRIAVLNAFNVNNLEIHPDTIVRRAELTGRYISEVDEELSRKYEVDVKHIVENVLGNLTKTNCESIANPFCDPNDLVEGKSILSFDCTYTIDAENLGLGGGYPYVKSFRLDQQHYADHLVCECDQTTD